MREQIQARHQKDCPAHNTIYDLSTVYDGKVSIARDFQTYADSHL